jgi:hypothetical protein
MLRSSSFDFGTAEMSVYRERQLGTRRWTSPGHARYAGRAQEDVSTIRSESGECG